MFSSIFSTSSPGEQKAPNLHPVASKSSPDQLVGELEPKDTEWLCASGFVTETQTFYTTTEDGKFVMCQVIHSSVGVWFPTIQFTFKFYDSKTKEMAWKSVNVSDFVTPPPGLDKRSSKAKEYSITYSSKPGTEFPESYAITANLSKDIQITLTVARPEAIPGFKVGKGPKGGYTYFGRDPEKADGYVVHRFWPHIMSNGLLVHKGQAINIKGNGMMVHAIQGMRPNLIATRWNFADFQSLEHGGCSAIQMEFKTTDNHGREGAGSGGVAVNVGSLVLGGKLSTVTVEVKWPNEEASADAAVKSRATHLNPVHDADTGYEAPTAIDFEWEGASVIPDAPGSISAKLHLDVGEPSNPKGLIEKVDVLAEIPKVIKMAVNYVAGAKPYIYQYFTPAVLHVTGPDTVVPGSTGSIDIEGMIYSEASFVS